MMPHPDPLICRFQLTLIESRHLRSELRHFRWERWQARELLRLLIFESASLRAEARSVCEEVIYRRSERSRTSPCRVLRPSPTS
jgi:hypothetical protein